MILIVDKIHQFIFNSFCKSCYINKIFFSQVGFAFDGCDKKIYLDILKRNDIIKDTGIKFLVKIKNNIIFTSHIDHILNSMIDGNAHFCKLIKKTKESGIIDIRHKTKEYWLEENESCIINNCGKQFVSYSPQSTIAAEITNLPNDSLLTDLFMAGYYIHPATVYNTPKIEFKSISLKR